MGLRSFNVELKAAKDIYKNETKQNSTRIGASVGLKSEIVNTVANIRDIDKLTDFSGDSYDVLNTASKVIGAIKDGATAINIKFIINNEGKTAEDLGFNTDKSKAQEKQKMKKNI